MRKILHTIQSGGSGTGFSFYKQPVDCARQFQLDQLARQQDNPTSGDNVATRTGTIYHVFQELHHDPKQKLFDTTAVEFTNVSDNVAQHEAERLFRDYRVHFHKNYWGKVISTEQFFPQNAAQAKRICDAVGVDPSTAKIDMVVYIDKKRAKELRQLHGFGSRFKEGYYLIDWKTDFMHRRDMKERYRANLQFTSYQLTYAAAFPKRILRGLIAVICVKTTKPQHVPIFIPPPSKDDVRALHNLYALSVHIQNDPFLKNRANPLHCHHWGKPCKWLGNGCRRY